MTVLTQRQMSSEGGKISFTIKPGFNSNFKINSLYIKHIFKFKISHGSLDWPMILCHSRPSES